MDLGIAVIPFLIRPQICKIIKLFNIKSLVFNESQLQIRTLIFLLVPNPQLNPDHLFDPTLNCQVDPLPANQSVPAFDFPNQSIPSQFLQNTDPSDSGLDSLLSDLFKTLGMVPQIVPVPLPFDHHQIPKHPIHILNPFNIYPFEQIQHQHPSVFPELSFYLKGPISHYIFTKNMKK
jgi:hypothetical protein